MAGTGDTGLKDGGVSVKTMKIKVEFTGGLELLFANQTSYTLHLPTTHNLDSTRPYTIADLIAHLVTHVMVDSRRELFVLESSPPHSTTTTGGGGLEGSKAAQYTIRPGILVLINDADWELEGEEKYELQDGDGVLFVSTLHGG